MTSGPFSDGVLRLALSPGEQRARTLLRAATELFVYQPRHTRSEIAVFEELGLQLMRSTPLEDRIEVARLLADRADAPPALMSMLLADEPEVAAPILAGAPHLDEVALLQVVAAGSPPHLDLVVRRPNLPAPVVEALVRRIDPDRLAVLLANPSAALPETVVPRLLDLARGNPALASVLSRRDDVEDADLTDLFLDLDERGRRRVLQALEILALRDFAARRPLQTPPRPDEEAVADLARAALSRDIDRVAGHLARLMRIDAAVARRILADPGGEPLAIGLRAAGLDITTASRVILFSGGQSVRDYFAVKRLIELYQSVSMRAATLLAGRWRAGAEPLPARVRRYQPQTEAGTPLRTRDGGLVRPARQEPPSPRRERG
jgi:uncharacterized protein (DUF2336 family)